MIEAIVIVFFKAICNSGLAFTNLAITDFFEPFRTGMLAFLFAMIYCGIREYQSAVKVVRLLNRKIAQSVYCLCIATHSHGFANIDDTYVYTDPLAMV